MVNAVLPGRDQVYSEAMTVDFGKSATFIPPHFPPNRDTDEEKTARYSHLLKTHLNFFYLGSADTSSNISQTSFAPSLLWSGNEDILVPLRRPHSGSGGS